MHQKPFHSAKYMKLGAHDITMEMNGNKHMVCYHLCYGCKKHASNTICNPQNLQLENLREFWTEIYIIGMWLHKLTLLMQCKY